jgi:hypothetical protein
MKYFGLFLAAITIFGWHGPPPQKTATTQPEKNPETYQEPPAKPVTVTGANTADGNQNQCPDKAENNREKSVKIVSAPEIETHSKKDPFDKALIVATCFLVIFGAFQIYYLWETVLATRDNAVAARLSAEAVINGQRPWLFVPTGGEFPEIGNPLLPDVGDKRECHVKFQFKNFGQTPGRIVEQKICLYIGESPELVPDARAFDTTDSLSEDYTFPPGETAPVQANLYPSPKITPQERQAIFSGARFLWLCGYCKYRSASDPGESTPYETRFCYLWINRTTRAHTFWVIRGPRKYMRAT